MKKLALVVAALVGLGVLHTALVFGASESGEVLELETTDSAGEAHTTRLWVVQDDGAWWIRGASGSGWQARLDASPEVRVVRGREVRSARATPVPEARDRINARFADKYGWADSLISLLLLDPSRSGAVPYRLDAR